MVDLARRVLAELKAETFLYIYLIVAAVIFWNFFSSSQDFSLSTKFKACITAACLFIGLVFFYTKLSATGNVRPTPNNPQWIPSSQSLDFCQSSWTRHAVSQASPTSCCKIFEYIMKLHARDSWGSVLDAGTGEHSLSWVTGLNTTKWTAITGSKKRADQMTTKFNDKIRPEDKVIFGNWNDTNMLKGEVYDVVLADYLLGSMDGFAPYFQDKLFERLKPHVKKHLYIVGMEPLPDSDSTPQGQLIIEIAKLRDACILLAGHRCYREYPLDWTLRQLSKSGYQIENIANFETVQTPDFVEIQLNVAESKLEFIANLQLVESLRVHIKQIRKKIYSMSWDIRFGSDYVISATKMET